MRLLIATLAFTATVIGAAGYATEQGAAQRMTGPEWLTAQARGALVWHGVIACETDAECENLSPVGPARFVGPSMFCDDLAHEDPRSECEQ